MDFFEGLGREGEEDVLENPGGAPAGRVWSSYQSAVFRNVSEGQGHTVIAALAGSGKTSTIIEAFKYVPAGATVMMCAFNKKIAEELKDRAPRGVEVSTLHSYGLRAVTKAFGRLQIDGNKVDAMVREVRGTGPGTFDARRALCKLVSLAKGAMAQTKDELLAIIEGYGIDGFGDSDRDREAAANDALLILAACKEPGQPHRSPIGKVGMGKVDFDDMVWLPVACSLRLWQFDRIFVDECQDLSPVQIELALRACKPSGRICVLGDKFQAIYGFRGADSRSIPNLVSRLRAHVMPLSVTYRCARAIVAEAQKYVPEIEAAPGAEEGEVRSCDQTQMKSLVRPGDFILSRTNAPLVPLCLGFLKEGRRAAVAGKDVGAQLESLVRKSEARTVDSLLDWVRAYGARETQRLLAKEEDPAPVQDRVETVEALCDGAQSVQEVLSRIEALFSDQDDSARIVLSSTHKAKGLERDRVFMLRDTYMRRDDDGERALAYVAVTRARKALWYVYSDK